MSRAFQHPTRDPFLRRFVSPGFRVSTPKDQRSVLLFNFLPSAYRRPKELLFSDRKWSPQTSICLRMPAAKCKCLSQSLMWRLRGQANIRCSAKMLTWLLGLNRWRSAWTQAFLGSIYCTSRSRKCSAIVDSLLVLMLSV